MTITKNMIGGSSVLALAGKLDALTAPQLEEALAEAAGENGSVTLDLDELKYVSSAGLRVIVGGGKACKDKGGELALVNVGPEVMKVFKMTGLVGVLNLSPKE